MSNLQSPALYSIISLICGDSQILLNGGLGLESGYMEMYRKYFEFVTGVILYALWEIQDEFDKLGQNTKQKMY